MPIPLRDDGSRGPSKRHIVFVHGFNDKALDCWGAMRDYLEQDATLSQAFEYSLFEYDTAIMRMALLRRLPGLDEIGAELVGYLDRTLVDGASCRDRYIDTTLVGHSMGGLVIQSCIVQLLNSGRGRELDRIRQAILFATPNFGSDLLKILRRLLTPIIPNPQEEALRGFSEQAMHIHQTVRERIIDARSRGDHNYPLPMYCFWGDSDDIVPQWSAKGYFPHGEPLKGNHSNLHKPGVFSVKHSEREAKKSQHYGPGNDSTGRYDAFVEALLHPHGHKHIWEVESYSYCARVSPHDSGSKIIAAHGGKKRVVETDNIAKVVRQIRFARNNRCPDPFELRYATSNDGWIDPQLPDHVTSAERVQIWNDGGTRIIVDVTPNPNQPATLAMTVYKGFDAGHRDYHMHLGNRAYFRRLLFEVDLADYVRAGWRVARAPQLYFHIKDTVDHRLCGNREMLDPDPPHEVDPRGIWRWTLEYLKEGVIDIVWDLAPAELATGRDCPSAIVLQPNEHAIFGYGSLLSIASLEKTLGRKYVGPFVSCDLLGWCRTWDVSMPNSAFAFVNESGAWVTPERILYLNATRSEGRRMNGIIFAITEEDLKMFDEREWIYERVQVNDDLRGVAVLEGAAWLFVGKPEHCVHDATDPRRTAIRRTYLDIVDSGLNDLGSPFVHEFKRSTQSIPSGLVINDQNRDKP
jgi:pimeloyl-ACP methyl ester carboxylesterase/cation transport regulator ChaC